MTGDDVDLAALLAATGTDPSFGADWLGSSVAWETIAPMASRLARRDPGIPVRLRAADGRRSALAVVPAGVLVGRTVIDDPDPAPVAAVSAGGGPADGGSVDGEPVDGTATAGDLLAWFDGGPTPPRADGSWRGGLPPTAGWRQIDTVPDTVVRDLVRQGALAHVEAAGREFGGAQGADALLDAVVLTVEAGGVRVELTNRALSAVTSMGFLPRGSHITVAVSGRWNRVAAAYGSVFTERAGAALTVL